MGIVGGFVPCAIGSVEITDIYTGPRGRMFVDYLRSYDGGRFSRTKEGYTGRDMSFNDLRAFEH